MLTHAHIEKKVLKYKQNYIAESIVTTNKQKIYKKLLTNIEFLN